MNLKKGVSIWLLSTARPLIIYRDRLSRPFIENRCRFIVFRIVLLIVYAFF